MKEEGNDIKVSEQNRKEFINQEQTTYVSGSGAEGRKHPINHGLSVGRKRGG